MVDVDVYILVIDMVVPRLSYSFNSQFWVEDVEEAVSYGDFDILWTLTT